MAEDVIDVTAKEPDWGHRLRRSAKAYERVLVGAGGKELEALQHAEGRGTLRTVVYASPPYALSVPPLPVSRISVNLTPAQVSGGIDGERPRHFDARRHSLFLMPAGQPVSWRKEAPSRHLSIYFGDHALDGGDEDATPFSPAPTLFNSNIPGIGQLIEQFVAEMRSPDVLSAEAADSYARLLLIRVARHLRCASKPPRRLTPGVLARLSDYVMAHLGERILVVDLAQQAGLSPNHFALAFTVQTGQSPHRFVLALRVKRAAELLARSGSSLAEVAHDCGFSSQQHLSNVVRSHLGTTPSRYRNLHKS